jgi:hypothetical protein
MTECVAVLLGTVQFRLKVKVVIPENATLNDAKKRHLQRSTITQSGIGRWSTS